MEDYTQSQPEAQTEGQAQAKKLVGFARLTPEMRVEYARRGGKAVHAAGKAHTWNEETARAAALKSHLNRVGKPTN